MSETLACTLTPGDREAREREIASLARTALLGAERTPDGIRLRLADEPAIAAQVDSLVERERRCCPFLDLEVERRDGEIVVAASGPPGAQPLFDCLLGIAEP